MTVGTNYSQMQYNYDPSMYGYTVNGGVVYNPQQTNLIATSQADSFSSSTDNTCTDGKDDGKIGFFSALGNAVQGVGKTIVNGIKGMFTNKEGKFSLGKTLLTVGTAALCIAVPAVGFAVACIGGVMGAVQIGKGAINAANATTDAEAKAAWEDIGGGAFTVGMSVVGAKAGVKAVKSTSTATNGLASLDDAATIGQKAKAFGHDMISSTTNNFKKIDNFATTSGIKETPKAIKQKHAVNKAKAEMRNAKTSAEYTAAKAKFDAAKADYNVSTQAKQNVAKLENIKNQATEAVKNPGETAKTIKGKVVDAKTTAKEVLEINKMRSANAKALAKQDAGQILSDSELQAIADWDALATKGFSQESLNIVNKQNTLQYNVSEKISGAKTYLEGKTPSVSNLKKSVSNSIKHPIKTSQAGWSKALKTIKGFNKQTIKDFGSKLSSPAQKAWDAISTGKYSYPEAVSEFGYESVAEIVQMMSGSVFAEDIV